MTKKSKGGRPSILDDVMTVELVNGSGERVTKKLTRRERILEVIRGGNFPLVAARACGVGESTWYEWLQRGRAGEQPYAELAEAVKDAEGQAEAIAIGRIQAAGADPKLWTANAWFLERKFPDRWGQTLRVEQKVEQELETMLDKLQAELSHEEFARVVAIIAPSAGGAAETGEPQGE